jgi:hypothetical protein
MLYLTRSARALRLTCGAVAALAIAAAAPAVASACTFNTAGQSQVYARSQAGAACRSRTYTSILTASTKGSLHLALVGRSRSREGSALTVEAPEPCAP